MFDREFWICGYAGATTALLTDLIYYPLETIKTRVMASWKTENIVQSAKSISKYKAFYLQLISMPASFIFFSTY